MSAEPRVNIRTSALELAEFLRENPSEIDKSELSIGSNYLAIYRNEQFKLNTEIARQLIQEALLIAIEDLATGGVVLRGGTMGVQFYENKLENFVSTHETPPLGTVVFRIAIKHLLAFQSWRTQEHLELPQLQTNCSIYYLISLLAKNEKN